MRRALPLKVAALALACALAACDHAQPFGAGASEPNLPFGAGYPRQLTFNAGADLLGAWLPDGSGIIYSYELPQADGDECLGVLPAEGGHRTASWCHVPPARDADSTNTLTEPATGPDSVLAYLRTSAALGARAPNSIELVVATLGNPLAGRTVLTVPYTAPDSVLDIAVGSLAWLNAHQLVYLVVGAVYADTVAAPVELSTIDVSTVPATIAVLPGTQGASSVAADAGLIYYTLGGDTHVYRYAAGAAPDTVFDFGAAGPASAIQVRGDVLVAYAGPTLLRANLVTGAVAPLAVPAAGTSGAALSPSGTRLVVEVSAGGASPDLWLLEVP